MYIRHPRFAKAPQHYIHPFKIIQQDMLDVFEYIEPADVNAECYSYRIHALHTRACIEVEANFKAILSENGYPHNADWNMRDYRRVERTHLLSGYEIRFPLWTGDKRLRKPFSFWASGNKTLPWYHAYNATKHDRHKNFTLANFSNLLDAISALVALLSAQFYTSDFSEGPRLLAIGSNAPAGFKNAIGDYFHVRFPEWPEEHRYDFDWHSINNETDPFQILEF